MLVMHRVIQKFKLTSRVEHTQVRVGQAGLEPKDTPPTGLFLWRHLVLRPASEVLKKIPSRIKNQGRRRAT